MRPITQDNWVTNAGLLWQRRRILFRVTAACMVVSALVAFTIPKQYESTARIMPPEQPLSGTAMLAALASRSLGGTSGGSGASALGGLGSLAGSLLGGRTSGALFIDLLHSRTVNDHVIDRFNLQRLYHKRYRIDTVKYMVHHTKIVEDKKSGVISITFTDTNAERARAITQGYLDELNSASLRSSVSSARREREFIEKRLVDVQAELQEAELALSQFSSVNTTLDIKEQTHAMVDAAARLQAELIVGHSEVDSLTQIYGEENVRVRAARARIASLQSELAKLSGSSAAPSEDANSGISDDKRLYPSLRQIPRLAVPYANLYRKVRIEETVFELLSQQYEIARLEEAKDTPVVSVVDPPLVAEKKSFPPRLLVMLILTAFSFAATSTYILLCHRLSLIALDDPRRLLAEEVGAGLRMQLQKVLPARARKSVL
nr:Wzz/FepE/Etk N-terminal domain-containing protein [Granulicella sp. dw_53]